MDIQESKKRKTSQLIFHARRLYYFARIVADKRSPESIKSYETRVGEPFTKTELVIDILTLGALFGILGTICGGIFWIYNHVVDTESKKENTTITSVDGIARDQAIKCIYENCGSENCINIFALTAQNSSDLLNLRSAAKDAKSLCQSKPKPSDPVKTINQTYGPGSPIISGNIGSKILNGGK